MKKTIILSLLLTFSVSGLTLAQDIKVGGGGGSGCECYTGNPLRCGVLINGRCVKSIFTSGGGVGNGGGDYYQTVLTGSGGGTDSGSSGSDNNNKQGFFSKLINRAVRSLGRGIRVGCRKTISYCDFSTDPPECKKIIPRCRINQEPPDCTLQEYIKICRRIPLGLPLPNPVPLREKCFKVCDRSGDPKKCLAFCNEDNNPKI